MIGMWNQGGSLMELPPQEFTIGARGRKHESRMPANGLKPDRSWPISLSWDGIASAAALVGKAFPTPDSQLRRSSEYT
jgi:hypothetical protein